MVKNLSVFIRNNSWLITICILAIILRFWNLTGNPPSLNWDEVSHGFNAYSILKTGRDEWRVFMPTIFRAFGDYKLPVYIYVTAMSEFMFGLTAFAVRLPSALAGVGTVIFTYLLSLALFKNKKIGLVAAMLVAVEPWSLFLSRGAFEANLALFFFVAGIYFFFKGLIKSNYFVMSSLFLGLTVWTYNSYRVFTPLMLLVLGIIYRIELLQLWRKQKVKVLIWITLFTLFIVPMVYQLTNRVGMARYTKVALIDEGAIAQIIEARQNSNYNPFVNRLLNNRPTYFLQKFTKNWLSHFSGSFLFFDGGSNYQFSNPKHGLLYVINLPFIVLGLVFLIKRACEKDKLSALLLAWLVLAPIPSSLTREAPQVLRSITILPVPMILTASGLFVFVEWSVAIAGKMILLFRLCHISKSDNWDVWAKRRNILYLTYTLLILILANSYLTNYFREYKKNYSWSWQYGYKEAVAYVKENYAKYDRIVVTKKYGEPHEFFLFLWPWDPQKFQSDPDLIRFFQTNWYWVDGFDKLYFVNDWAIPKLERQPYILESGGRFSCEAPPVDLRPLINYPVVKCLLITSPGNAPQGLTKLKTINFLNGDPAFEIYEN